jgi:broad specificity phosphatase PhoE
VRLFVLARHGESVLNVERRINGDPSVEVALSERGKEEARRLGEELAHIPIDVCVHTRFERTAQTARLALGDRNVAFEVEPDLDDIDVGELEGQTIEDYRAWKRAHERSDAFPGGESLDAAAQRYAQAFQRLVARTERVTLVVAHEIAVRYAVNAAAGSDELDAPTHDIRNAAPYLFDEQALARAAQRIGQLVGSRSRL